MSLQQTYIDQTDNTRLLNQALVVVLWIKLLLSALWLLLGICVHFTESLGMPVWEDYLAWALSLVAICGTWLFLKVNRWGFYLLAGSNLISIGWAIVDCCTICPVAQEIPSFSMSPMWINIVINAGELALILLLMLLKQNGKNAYWILWKD